MKRMKTWWGGIFSRSLAHLRSSRRIRERVRLPAAVEVERLEERTCPAIATMTLDIQDFVILSGGDTLSEGDFYVKIYADVAIGFFANGLVNRERQLVKDTSEGPITPDNNVIHFGGSFEDFWSVSWAVDASNPVMIQIEVWDQDDFLNGDDDQVDLMPSLFKYERVVDDPETHQVHIIDEVVLPHGAPRELIDPETGWNIRYLQKSSSLGFSGLQYLKDPQKPATFVSFAGGTEDDELAGGGGRVWRPTEWGRILQRQYEFLVNVQRID